jgi:hypothetical protein
MNMKTAWAFGGKNNPWIHSVCDGFDTTFFGRHNVDYTDVNSFINSHPTPPDIIVYNISNAGHDPDYEKITTSDVHFERLHNIIDSTYRFQLNLLEWFFGNFENKRLLWITSMEPYNMYPSEDVNEFDGDILLYRQVRALEHQAIYQQNIKPSNVNKNNTALGVCVANNQDDIVTKLNSVLKEDLFDHGVIGLLDNSPMTADYLSAVTASLITVNVKS